MLQDQHIAKLKEVEKIFLEESSQREEKLNIYQDTGGITGKGKPWGNGLQILPTGKPLHNSPKTATSKLVVKETQTQHVSFHCRTTKGLYMSYSLWRNNLLTNRFQLAKIGLQDLLISCLFLLLFFSIFIYTMCSRFIIITISLGESFSWMFSNLSHMVNKFWSYIMFCSVITYQFLILLVALHPHFLY